MKKDEAFRISLGKFEFDRPVTDTHKKELAYKDAVDRLLKPLKIADRLHFCRHADRLEAMDWLVVKIESSGQRSLLDDIDQNWLEDLELSRECGAAVDLAQVALRVFRKLISQSRMSPTQFHRLVAEGGQAFETAWRMMRLADDHGEGVVAVRSPEGNDDIAKTYPIPGLVTLSEIEEGRFFVHMVGRTGALIYRAQSASGASRPSRNKKIELHWGNGAMRQSTADHFDAARNAFAVIKVRHRATYSKQGKVIRLEWCPDAEAEDGVSPCARRNSDGPMKSPTALTLG